MDGVISDILIPKTSCSVFNSTNIAYVLRNLQIEQIVLVGQLTDQCVESAVRDAADLGFFVTVVDDACAATGVTRASAWRRLHAVCWQARRQCPPAWLRLEHAHQGSACISSPPGGALPSSKECVGATPCGAPRLSYPQRQAFDVRRAGGSSVRQWRMHLLQ